MNALRDEPVSVDVEHGLFVLRTPNSVYALRIGEDGSPRHVYWGEPLDVTELRGWRSPSHSSFEADPAPDELPIETGARFGPAGLRVRFADGVRGAQWRYVGYEIEDGVLRIKLEDRFYPLACELVYRVRRDSDVIERWTEVRHTGADDPDDPDLTANVAPEAIVIERCDSASWTLPKQADYRLSHLVGGWGSETQLQRDRLPVAETVLVSRRGTTSHHANPWLALDAGDAGETSGRVWSAALAWSGSWRIAVHRDPVGRVTFTGGYGHEAQTFRIEPSERIVTPVFAGLYSGDGFGGTSRAWHEYARRHVLPHPEEDRPVLYNSWEAMGFDLTEAKQLELAGLAARTGVELFVVDDGWFGARRDDHAGLGDWTTYPGAFPNGLRPLADEVHRLGMRFGLWVEPEMVNADSDLFRAHPEWVVHAPTRQATELRNQLLLNLARTDVAAWVYDTLDRLVRENDVDFFKWDMNRPFTEAAWPGAPDPDRLWALAVQNVYGIIDRLREAHPGLRIEGCSSGGGRIDLGMLARVDQVWTSDNTDPVDRIEIQAGYGQVYPAAAMAAWASDSPSPITFRETPLRFRFHVAMAGALGIGGNLTEWSEAELAEAAELVGEYKEVRALVQRGVAYRVQTADGVSGVHYAAPDDSEHAVLLWRPTMRFAHEPAPVPLPGLRAGARYRDLFWGVTYSGEVLRERGLEPGLPAGDYASRLIRLVRVDE
ncbi:alpha-galactosidase [Catenulispora sp. NF23]|uniref:Alpha-galactosidase n=1 Tax=Catenulispora pinistramenti TaxID=2705254 RepID=A0ABS5L1W9_9ACTN|nr:alpha-galactosidase [Catenulispora pinistramenti]MBS2536612.1 alpha-galactosidase [Catenulispora pinistramenti]MBS2552244.1 alpha-galactosidase [Catenulispora pinistramenti]